MVQNLNDFTNLLRDFDRMMVDLYHGSLDKPKLLEKTNFKNAAGHRSRVIDLVMEDAIIDFFREKEFSCEIEAEERGRIAGFVIFSTFLIVAFTSVIAANLGLITIIVIGIFLRATSYIVCLIDPCKRESEKPKSWINIISHRLFSSYLFPWFMFDIASGLMPFVFLSLPQTRHHQTQSYG